ncbi:PPE family protein [Mycobacterium vicinigordonae]|uniref:PPE family protein n=1 Tax=Mycobacterium vicinigordonae TaxID=1719132 RepID=A0A7D6E4T8_9MYCO|nr:PPE domain-containing protein [Mycobacterium vicinigordonae]QLL09681.1 PPE family protein [Mycobacterium vicinigordonae]
MFDFGALPPEINSTRIYAGPGSYPMLAAAAAWDALAAQLELFGTGYCAAIATLQGQSWSGAASAAMAAAVAPYLAWVATTAQQAEHSANQARAAATAFEAAFAATVPPTEVAANRALLAALVATNFFGQNTAAIAAVEAAYAEMWAQDAAAMYNYAASSSTAVVLTPFSEPPQTAGNSQVATSQLISALPQHLETLATEGAAPSATSTPALTIVSELNTLTGPLTLAYQMPYTTFSGGSFFNGLTQSKIQASTFGGIEQAETEIAHDVEGEAAATAGVPTPVAAGLGQGKAIGDLTVPQGWAGIGATTPGAEPAIGSSAPQSRLLPPWAGHPGARSWADVTGVGRLADGGERRGANTAFRMRDRRYRIPRPALGG